MLNILLSDFFKTRQTFQNELGEGVKMWSWFGPTHLILLAITIIFCTIFCILYKKSDDGKRKILRWILCGLMIAEEIWMFTISFITKQFEVGFLPFQLCGINIFFCIWHSIKQRPWLEDFLYGLALPGALIALVVPTWTGVPAWNYIFIFSSGYHIFLITYPIMLLVGGLKPNYKNLWKVGLVLLALSVVFFGVNQFNAYMVTKTGNAVLWSSNFMFLYKSESILTLVANALHLKGMWYLITLPFMLLIVWAIFYLPWIITEGIKKKRNTVEE